ncbi:hypothetical protein TREMEDRAFT_28205, partial [Tremella mesenterica DSM 1558]|uniref:uncharacterized protein n=1 Tax=Tremella mesenterica (strain ATCC 24925 / CBS 8224 / DSM 1558 / NBRC 9311 / NRRL Y-6157 / RJB 2259-6 / UBC 559-6) TaxID=578456 RepID=UPI0003F49068
IDEEEEAYTYAEVEVMLEYLREEGVPRFMTWYLTPKSDGSIPSLTKLLYSLGQDLPEPLRDPRLEARYLHQYTHNILWRIVRDRERLPHLNSVEDALTLIRDSKNILVLSGAGISTSSGIPDFRSKGGLYSILREECHPQLDQPEDVFDIKVFQESPEIFYSVARKIFPGQIQPGPCHRWIKMLEEKGQLLRNYTQNIDNLEGQAGVKRVVQCHGSFATASCLRCRRRVPGSDLEPYISSCTVPFCPDCRKEKEEHLKELRSYKRAKLKAAGKGKAKATRWQDPDSSSSEDEWAGGPPGVMKPDITFFHESLKSEFQHHLADDRSKADLVIIIGTSLEVRPVSELTCDSYIDKPDYLPHSVPQILINAQPLKYHKPDICLLGDADSIVQYICHALEWPLPTSQHTNSPRLSHLPLSLPPEDVTFQCPVDM